MALGSNATANNPGSFVYGDNSGNAVSDVAGANSFTVLATGGYQLYSDATTTPAMSILAGNSPNYNVGIGTASPAVNLEIDGGSFHGEGPTMMLVNGTGGAGAAPDIDFSTTGNNTAPDGRIILTDDGNYAGAMDIETSPDNVGGPVLAPVSRINIQPSGNVGINTTTPASTLEVNGDVTMDAHVIATDNATASASGNAVTVSDVPVFIITSGASDIIALTMPGTAATGDMIVVINEDPNWNAEYNGTYFGNIPAGGSRTFYFDGTNWR